MKILYLRILPTGLGTQIIIFSTQFNFKSSKIFYYSIFIYYINLVIFIFYKKIIIL